MKEEKKKRQQIRPSITPQMAQYLTRISGIKVTDGASFKAALRKLFPDFPEDDSSGAPEGNKNASKKRAKGE